MIESDVFNCLNWDIKFADNVAHLQDNYIFGKGRASAKNWEKHLQQISCDMIGQWELSVKAIKIQLNNTDIHT